MNKHFKCSKTSRMKSKFQQDFRELESAMVEKFTTILRTELVQEANDTEAIGHCTTSQKVMTAAPDVAARART